MTIPPLSEEQIANNTESAIHLLSQLISTPSLSREEETTADLLCEFLERCKVAYERKGNNVWAKSESFDPSKPTILLNSHHDTVKPNEGYTRDPFDPEIVDGKLYGLGSNDAGASLVCLLHTFLAYYSGSLPFNLLLAMTAEEEISGSNGVASILDEIGLVSFGIVGEPTGMQMAVAEKGLMVLDCYSKGVSGHAAREEGENAIYKALKDIQWFKDYQFEETSDTLGPIKMSVTMIQSGYQHNVVPDTCHFVVDVRTTDAYSNLETLEIIRDHVSCEVKPRSTRLNPSGLVKDHALLQAAKALGLETYGSPTLSDQALMPFATCKMGPGQSARSHTADEYILIDEIKQGIAGYHQMICTLAETLKD